MNEQLELDLDDHPPPCRRWTRDEIIRHAMAPKLEAVVEAIVGKDYGALSRAVRKLSTYAWETYYRGLRF